MYYLRYDNPTSSASNGIPANTKGKVFGDFSMEQNTSGQITAITLPGANATFGDDTDITSIGVGSSGSTEINNGPVQLNGMNIYIGDVIDTSSLQAGEAQRITISHESTNSGANNDDNRVFVSDITPADLVGQTWQFSRFGTNSATKVQAEITRTATAGNDGVLIFLDTALTGFVDGTDAGGTIESITPAVSATGVWEVSTDSGRTVASNR